MNWNDTIFLLPEIVLAVGASILLVLPVLGARRNPASAKWWMFAILAVTFASLVYASHAVETITPSFGFAAMFALDGFAIFFKVLLLVTLAVIVILSDEYLLPSRYSPWEYYSLLAFALCGMMFMVSGVHLAAIYIGLELLSLSSYILAGYFKTEEKSTEAAMKYFILGAVSSAILLYGISLIYGVCGTLNLLRIASAIGQITFNEALMFGIMLLGAGLCFKIAAAPFHVWTPDVYEGAPTPITAFLSTASKTAAFAVVARVFYVALHGFQFDWSYILAAVSALSMIIGNLAAITQSNVKRMLAYSSIGHAGYVLLGIVSLNAMGVRGVLVYSTVYVFATLGIWATVLMLRRHAYAGELVDDFDGLSKRSPFLAFAMVVFLLSLGGIPPTAGFIGKYYLFYAAVQSGFGSLAVVAVLMSAVSMFYYLRLVMAMYLKEGREADVVITRPLQFVAAACLVVTLVLGVWPGPLAQQADKSSVWTTKTAVPTANAGR